MKSTFLSLVFAVSVVAATAAPRSIEEMRSIAASHMQQRMASTGIRRAPAAKPSPQLLRFNDAYAVFTPEEGEGFVIVNRDDAARPILGYSATGFPSTDMPDGLQWFLEQAELSAKAGSVRRNAATFTPTDTSFVTTTWAQDHPFNQLTPNKYPAGCVAVALAQCLNYCQWPASVEFEGTCSVTTKVGRKEKTEDMSLDINSTYTWPYKDNYKSVGRAGDNIDELLRDCGYATYMSYTSTGSGTMSLYAGIALTHIYDYPERSVRYVERIEMATQDEWAQLIYDELAARSPVFYGADDESFGGHAFVLSGVDQDGLVYINWGWRGNADGFYNLADLNPTQGSQQMHFNNYAEILCGIRKEPLPTDRYDVSVDTYSGEPYTFSWRTMKDTDSIAHNTLYINIPQGFINYHPVDFMGVFGLFADDLTDGTSWIIDPTLQDRDTLPSGYSFGRDYEDFAFYYYVDGDNGLKPGHTYRMSFGFCDDRDGIWHSLKCRSREIAYDVVYTGNPETSTVAAEPTTPPVLTAIASLPADDYRGSNLSRYEKTSAVTRVYDSAGRLVHTAPTATFNLWDVRARGILVIDDGRSRRKVVR